MPANPSLASSVLDPLTPAALPNCYDLDQIVAAQVTHTCTRVDGITTPVIGTVGCVTSQGARVPPNSSETYYTQDSLIQIQGGGTATLACGTPACNGILSVLAFNYHPNNGSTLIYDDALCLTTSSGASFVGEQCDLTNPDQLIRVTRSTAALPSTTSSNTSTSTSSNDISLGKVGTLCNLFHRASGLYIDIDSGGSNLALSSNTDYIWALLRPMNGDTVSSPQQIVYVGGVSPEELPQFNAVLSFEDLINLIIELGLPSIQLNSAGGLILAPFYTYPLGTDPIPPEAWLASMYPVQYSLFGPILLTTEATNLS